MARTFDTYLDKLAIDSCTRISISRSIFEMNPCHAMRCSLCGYASRAQVREVTLVHCSGQSSSAPGRYLRPEQRLGSLGSPANSPVAATLTL